MSKMEMLGEKIFLVSLFYEFTIRYRSKKKKTRETKKKKKKRKKRL